MAYRQADDRTEVLLVHPGGPLWRHRWQGWWQLPKGAPEPGEDMLAAARREFVEETGVPIRGPPLDLGEVRQRAGKRVIAFAIAQDLDAAGIRSNHFSMEWPPHSGRQATFPEIDAARWFDLDAAAVAILPSQRPFLDRLRTLLIAAAPPETLTT